MLEKCHSPNAKRLPATKAFGMPANKARYVLIGSNSEQPLLEFKTATSSQLELQSLWYSGRLFHALCVRKP